MPNDNKFAVLIDADNVSERYIKIILDEISKDGIATYKRIYGDWTRPELGSWKKVLLDHSILPVQQYGYTSGKNATDSAMIIDAMDILYSGQVEGFCLVSSDSDFTRLAARLRESGMIVVGMGERKTPKAFISACNRFKYLDILATVEPASAPPVAAEAPLPVKARSRGGRVQEQKEAPPAPEAQSEQSETGLATIKEALRAIVAENSDEDDRLFIGTIGNLLVKRYPDFDVRNYGYSKLTPFIRSLGMFEIQSERGGEGSSKLIYVKLK